MVDPDLMTDLHDVGPSNAFGALAVLALVFVIGFGLGWLVAWL